MELMRLDQVFRLAARTVDDLVEDMLQALEIGDDEPGIDAEIGGLDAGNHPALELPVLGAVAEFAVAANLVEFGMGIAVDQSAGDVALDHPGQHRVAREAEDVTDPVALAPVHGLGPAIVAVAADDDLDRRPAGAQGAHDMAQHQRDLGPAAVLPGRRTTATGLPVVAS